MIADYTSDVPFLSSKKLQWLKKTLTSFTHQPFYVIISTVLQKDVGRNAKVAQWLGID